MSSHTVPDTEARSSLDDVDTHTVTSTAGPDPSQTPSSPSPVRPPRGVLTAAALTTLAAVALTPWLLTTSSQTETSSTTPTAASQQPAPAMGQASRSWNAASAGAPAAYVMFCQNSPALCSAPPVPALTNAANLQFCWNSPTLCRAPKHN